MEKNGFECHDVAPENEGNALASQRRLEYEESVLQKTLELQIYKRDANQRNMGWRCVVVCLLCDFFRVAL